MKLGLFIQMFVIHDSCMVAIPNINHPETYDFINIRDKDISLYYDMEVSCITRYYPFGFMLVLS